MSEIVGGFGGGRDSLSRMVGGKTSRIRSLLSVFDSKALAGDFRESGLLPE